MTHKACICGTESSRHDDYCPMWEREHVVPAPARAETRWVVTTTHRQLPLVLGAAATQATAERCARDMTLLIGEQIVSVVRS